MKLKLSGKKYFFILSFIVFILLGLVVGFLYLSFHFDIKKAQEQEASLIRETVFLRDILSRRKAQENMMPLIQKKKSSLIIREITELALKHNIRLVSLAPSSVVDGQESFYKKALFTAEASASFKDLGLFLAALKEAKSIMDIDSLIISADDKGADIVNAKITFAVWVEENYGQR